MPEVQEKVYEDLHEAIQRAVNDENGKVAPHLGGSILTKWVVVMEMMDGEGNKWITGFRGPTPNAVPMWDAKGLLMYCAQDLDTMDEDDEEED